jgi:MSHA biogenesis protein MshJ
LLAKEVDKVRADAETSKAQVQVIVGQLARDPDMLARARIAKLSKEARDLDDQMGKINRSLIPPQRMAKILEGMLARDRQVQLVSLKTLPVTTLVERDATDDRANVYKHGIVMTLQGRYLDLLTYLNALEALPWQMFWSQAQMDARDYTAVRVTVTVFTLSLDKDWLVV